MFAIRSLGFGTDIKLSVPHLYVFLQLEPKEPLVDLWHHSAGCKVHSRAGYMQRFEDLSLEDRRQ